MSLQRFIDKMFWHPSEFHEVTRITEGEAPTRAKGHVPGLQLPAELLSTRRAPPISSTRWEYKIAD